ARQRLVAPPARRHPERAVLRLEDRMVGLRGELPDGPRARVDPDEPAVLKVEHDVAVRIEMYAVDLDVPVVARCVHVRRLGPELVERYAPLVHDTPVHVEKTHAERVAEEPRHERE